MDHLTSRQQSILNRVVDTHIDTAQPVASKTVTEHYRVQYNTSFSSATVRHEMGLLEEKGYLTHPHTSSGRVPTDNGYRYYVDHCLSREAVEENIFGDLDPFPFLSAGELDDLSERTCRSLSNVSREMALVLAPSSRRALKSDASGFRLFFHGSSYLMEKPEFQTVRKIQKVFKWIEERNQIVSWLLERAMAEGLTVSIGCENQTEELDDCTVILTPYSMHGKKTGIVGLVGPKRMKYSRALPLVDSMAHNLGRVLESWSD